MRGGSSDRASTAGEAGTVSKRRQESLEKHAGGTKLGARQMRIRKVKRGGAKQRRSERMGGGGGGGGGEAAAATVGQRRGVREHDLS